MDLEEKIRRGVCGVVFLTIGGYMLSRGSDVVPDMVKNSRLLFEQI